MKWIFSILFIIFPTITFAQDRSADSIKGCSFLSVNVGYGRIASPGYGNYKIPHNYFTTGLMYGYGIHRYLFFKCGMNYSRYEIIADYKTIEGEGENHQVHALMNSYDLSVGLRMITQRSIGFRAFVDTGIYMGYIHVKNNITGAYDRTNDKENFQTTNCGIDMGIGLMHEFNYNFYTTLSLNIKKPFTRHPILSDSQYRDEEPGSDFDPIFQFISLSVGYIF